MVSAIGSYTSIIAALEAETVRERRGISGAPPERPRNLYTALAYYDEDFVDYRYYDHRPAQSDIAALPDFFAPKRINRVIVTGPYNYSAAWNLTAKGWRIVKEPAWGEKLGSGELHKPFPITYGDWVNLAEDIKASRPDDAQLWSTVNDRLNAILYETGNIDTAKRWLVEKAGELGIK